jgi:hypothetical protein
MVRCARRATALAVALALFGMVSLTPAAAQAPDPTRLSPRSEQLAAAAAVLFIKPMYMLLSLLLVIVLWRREAPDLAALRWGLVCFLIGETACAVDIGFFDHGSRALEFVHMGGMVLGIGFAAYALLEGLDRRILHVSDPRRRCAAHGLCARCWKQSEVDCTLKRLSFFALPALCALAFIPLLARTSVVSYDTEVFGTVQHYSHAVVYQVFAWRYCPLLAIGLLVASLLFSVRGRTVSPYAKVTLAAGLGALGLSLLRLILFSVYREDLVWFTFWEESTELLGIAGVALVLWLFRAGLLPSADTDARGEASAD